MRSTGTPLPGFLTLGEELSRFMEVTQKKAEHFVFHEFFIVEDGKMGRSLEVLDKAGEHAPLYVRRFGCVFRWVRPELSEKGINILPSFVPFWSLVMNNRHYRKLRDRGARRSAAA